MSEHSRRNIILFSDGTGNSSVSPQKSNVWRLYQALDLKPDADGVCRQIAFYDDGVGTLGFKPLQLLGGAFGWGLSRNVRQLYENLCRYYRPGDRIYIFGFSRGAFTARVLAHFISRCGILDRNKRVQGHEKYRMDTDRGLKKGVKRAYKSYRHHYWQGASSWLRCISKGPRFLRNLIPWWNVIPDKEFKRSFSLGTDVDDTSDKADLIEFIGVWDTVDAVGLPVDELSIALDKLIYPYKFTDCNFSPDVARGRQALAIDDERHSFHPLLWNEADRRDEETLHDIMQVWFAGMHSNVGGSYPEDQLAHISLAWMIDEVKETANRTGLNFPDEVIARIRKQAGPLGKMYDSRRGAAVYYRYKPRNIAELCNQEGNGSHVKVSTPKIHHTVLDRIADNTVGYAPTALPRDFDVIGDNGNVLSLAPGDRHHETDRQQKYRTMMLERAKNHIFWRRFAYFFLLFITLTLILFPYYRPPIPGLERTGASEKVSGWILDLISSLLPGIVTYWTEAWSQSPKLFAGLLISFIGFFLWSGWIKGNTQQVAESGWWHLKGLEPPPPRRKVGFFEKVAGFYRSNRWTIGLHEIFKKYVLAPVFVAICAYLTLAASYRLLIHYPVVKAGACAYLGERKVESIPEPRESVVFNTTDTCLNSDITLEEGRVYDVKVLGDIDWIDGEETKSSIDGFDSWLRPFHPIFLTTAPTRRHLTMPWFTLTGEIGKDTGHVFPINRKTFTFKAPADGTLYFYVNDAINVIGPKVSPWLEKVSPMLGIGSLISPDIQKSISNPNVFYENNQGKVTITVKPQAR